MATQIIPMILGAMKTKFVAVLQTPFPESDPTRVLKVKLGRWQDDPTKDFVYTAISGGDPDDPKYADGIVTMEEMKNIGFTYPAREIGGGQAWWRRGIVNVGCYYLANKIDEESAISYAYTVLGRVETCIETTTVSNLVDSFGEQAIQMFCYGNTFFETGGPPDKYIFRGKIMWSCLTERN